VHRNIVRIVRAGALLVGVCWLAVATASATDAGIDPELESAQACGGVLQQHIKSTYPAADRISFDFARATLAETVLGDRLVGTGSYSGKSGRGRSFGFECVYDPFRKQVTKATWESSFEAGRTWSALDRTAEIDVRPGDVRDACNKALDERIRETWKRYESFEFDPETVARGTNGSRFRVSGDGDFRFSSGASYGFRFQCLLENGKLDLQFDRLKSRDDADE
jgi:hypothetical protein